MTRSGTGASKVANALDSLVQRFNGQPFEAENNCTLLALEARSQEYACARGVIEAEPDLAKVWKLCEQARDPLELLDLAIQRAERPPFLGWYAPTWIRTHQSLRNVHLAYRKLRAFLGSGGKRAEVGPQ